MTDVLLVSKPVAPPWNDGGKNIVRDVALHTTRARMHVMTTFGTTFGAPHVVAEPVFSDGSTFAPTKTQHLRVVVRLLRPDSIGVWHFFFAPNARTSAAARSILHVRRRRSVQTVSSVPRDVSALRRLLFAERVVTLSAWTAARLTDAGVRGVRHIPPMVAPSEPGIADRRGRVRAAAGLPADRPLIVFPGDLEFGDAAEVVADAARRLGARSDACVVFACREKTPKAREHAARMRRRLHDLVTAGRVAFPGEVADPRALFAEAHAVVLPASGSYAKTDLPLSLLEAMAEGTPIVVADADPVRECLGSSKHAPANAPGIVVPAGDGAAVAEALRRLLRDEREREEMGEAARRWTASAFGATALGEAHAEVYEELVARRGGGS